MRSYPSCWNKVLTQLNFRRKRRKASKRYDYLNRRSLFEILEERQMLSGDPLLDLSSEETVVTAEVTSETFVIFSSQPEFFLIQPEIPAEELDGLSKEEIDAIEPIFAVKTIQTETGPQAILSFNPAFRGNPPNALQKLSLELRQDGRVVDSYEILIDIAEESFREQFLADRIEAVAGNVTTLDPHEIANWLGETSDYAELRTNSEFVSDSEFASLLNFVGPLTLEQSTVLWEGLTQQSDQLSQAVAPTADFLISLAKSQAELKDIFVDRTERERFYGELEKHTQTVKQDRLAATTDAEREAVSKREKSLRDTTLLLAKDLREDLKSENIEIARAARKLRDELVAISGPYETAFAGLGVDQEIERKITNSGDEKAVSFVETGRYVFNDRLEIDLGEHQAMVQVIRSSNLRFAALTSVSESPAVEDGSIDEANDGTNGGTATSLHVDGTLGALQESLIRFNLAEVATLNDPTTIASAALQLTEIGTGTGNAEVYIWNGLFEGPAGSVTDWDETNLNWIYIDEVLELSQSVGEFTQLSDWAAGTTTEVDVTSQLQRALLFGDANGDGDFSVNGSDGDIEAFHLAVTNWDAYQAEYGPRANSASDLLARNDGGLGDGTIDTADISDFFKRHGFSQGDYNLDGTVQDNADSGIDGLDWAVFNANYGLTNAKFTQGDGNFDGVVGDEDFDIWFDRKGEDNLSPVEPEVIFWVRPEDATTDIDFASQEHTTLSGPTLVIEEQPDLALNRFSVEGSNLVVDYAVLGTDFTNVKVQLYKTGSPDVLLHETVAQSRTIGSYEVLIASNEIASIVEGDSIYAKVVGTPSTGTQSNTTNDQLDFEFSTASTQTVNSLDDLGMDTLLRDKHTLRELLDANEALGWFSTLTFDDTSLFDSGPGTITLGDHDQDGVADELKIKQDLVIEGPGSHLLTIGARLSSRVFNISNGSTSNLLDVSISDLTITDGNTSSSGGGIYNFENLTLDGVVVRDSSASYGGGIYHNYGTLVIHASSFENNQALSGGGVFGKFLSVDSLDVANSTFSNNTATTGGGGGFLFKNVDYGSDSSGTIVNSTFSGNNAETHGGGLRIRGALGADTDVTLVNTTVTGNSALIHAGGVFSYREATVTLHNTIVAGNTISGSSTHATDAAGPIGGTTAVPSSNNLIGYWYSGLGLSDGVNGNQTGTTSVPLDPRLAPLDTYGGRTLTHALYEDSPAIDRGNDAQAVDAAGNPLLVDQRGFARVLDVVGIHNEGTNIVDIGAFEDPCVVPEVDVLTDVNESGKTTLRNAINQARTATDKSVRFKPSLFADGMPKEIELTYGVAGNDQVDELLIDSNLTIFGPGSDLLSINANDKTRVFSVAAGTTAEIRDLTITGGNAGTSIGDHGGGIYVSGNLTLTGVQVVANEAGDKGGGVYVAAPASGDQKFVVVDSTFDNNDAKYGGGLYYNAVGALGTVDVDITGTTFSNNSAITRSYSKGGGLYVKGSTSTLDLDISNSTISQNTASLRGGGVYLWQTGDSTKDWKFTNDTVVDNQTTDDQGGGGIFVGGWVTTTVELNNTIVARNTNNGTANPDDVYGDFAVSSNYNLIGVIDGSTGLNVSPSKWGELATVPLDPGLASLGNFGGPAQTHAILSGSPAIDAGSDVLAVDSFDVPLAFDQRGKEFGRVIDQDGAGSDNVDIGAYESNRYLVTTTDPVLGTGLLIYGTPGDDNIAVTAGAIYFEGVGGPATAPPEPLSSYGFIHVYGTDGDDTLTMLEDTPLATLFGGLGDDVLISGIGNDVLDGGAGDDTYRYTGDVTVGGGLGVDTIVETRGNGNDTLDFGGVISPEGLVLDLSADFDQPVFSNGVSSFLVLSGLAAAEIENVTGTALNDTIAGNQQDNLLDGLGGNDRLYGLGGNDTLIGGLGDDYLAGGLGSEDQLIGGSGFDNLETIDDSLISFTTGATGNGFSLQSDANAFEGTYVRASETSTPSSLSEAAWAFTGLQTTGEAYEVFVSWPDLIGVTPATNASFKITTTRGGVPTDAPSVVVDQTLRPTGNQLAERPWQSLGVVENITGNLEQLAVTLTTDGADGVVLVDGIRLEAISSPPDDSAPPATAGAVDGVIYRDNNADSFRGIDLSSVTESEAAHFVFVVDASGAVDDLQSRLVDDPDVPNQFLQVSTALTTAYATILELDRWLAKQKNDGLLSEAYISLILHGSNDEDVLGQPGISGASEAVILDMSHDDDNNNGTDDDFRYFSAPNSTSFQDARAGFDSDLATLLNLQPKEDVVAKTSAADLLERVDFLFNSSEVNDLGADVNRHVFIFGGAFEEDPAAGLDIADIEVANRAALLRTEHRATLHGFDLNRTVGAAPDDLTAIYAMQLIDSAARRLGSSEEIAGLQQSIAAGVVVPDQPLEDRLVYHDANDNDLRDANESYVYTDASGRYSFDEAPEVSEFLVETFSSSSTTLAERVTGWAGTTITTSAIAPVVPAADIGLTVTEGGIAQTGSISGYKYKDLDADGVRDGGEFITDSINSVQIILDVSGSTTAQFLGGESVGDVDGDGLSNTILDAEIQAAYDLIDYIQLENASRASNDIQITARIFGYEAEDVIISTPNSPETPGEAQSIKAVLLNTITSALLQYDIDIGPNEICSHDFESVTGTDLCIQYTGYQGPGKFHNISEFTNYEDALSNPPNSNDSTVIVFVSDGKPNAPSSEYEWYDDEIAAIEDNGNGASIKAFGVGSLSDQATLDQLDTNGAATIFFETTALREALTGYDLKSFEETGAEPGLANWIIELYQDADDDNHFDPEEQLTPYATTVTDADGAYRFDDLPVGTYFVREVQQRGYQQTGPDAENLPFLLQKHADDVGALEPKKTQVIANTVDGIQHIDYRITIEAGDDVPLVNFGNIDGVPTGVDPPIGDPPTGGPTDGDPTDDDPASEPPNQPPILLDNNLVDDSYDLPTVLDEGIPAAGVTITTGDPNSPQKKIDVRLGNGQVLEVPFTINDVNAAPTAEMVFILDTTANNEFVLPYLRDVLGDIHDEMENKGFAGGMQYGLVIYGENEYAGINKQRQDAFSVPLNSVIDTASLPVGQYTSPYELASNASLPDPSLWTTDIGKVQDAIDHIIRRFDDGDDETLLITDGRHDALAQNNNVAFDAIRQALAYPFAGGAAQSVILITPERAEDFAYLSDPQQRLEEAGAHQQINDVLTAGTTLTRADDILFSTMILPKIMFDDGANNTRNVVRFESLQENIINSRTLWPSNEEGLIVSPTSPGGTQLAIFSDFYNHKELGLLPALPELSLSGAISSIEDFQGKSNQPLEIYTSFAGESGVTPQKVTPKGTGELFRGGIEITATVSMDEDITDDNNAFLVYDHDSTWRSNGEALQSFNYFGAFIENGVAEWRIGRSDTVPADLPDFGNGPTSYRSIPAVGGIESGRQYELKIRSQNPFSGSGPRTLEFFVNGNLIYNTEGDALFLGGDDYYWGGFDGGIGIGTFGGKVVGYDLEYARVHESGGTIAAIEATPAERYEPLAHYVFGKGGNSPGHLLGMTPDGRGFSALEETDGTGTYEKVGNAEFIYAYPGFYGDPGVGEEFNYLGPTGQFEQFAPITNSAVWDLSSLLDAETWPWVTESFASAFSDVMAEEMLLQYARSVVHAESPIVQSIELSLEDSLDAQGKIDWTNLTFVMTLEGDGRAHEFDLEIVADDYYYDLNNGVTGLGPRARIPVRVLGGYNWQLDATDHEGDLPLVFSWFDDSTQVDAQYATFASSGRAGYENDLLNFNPPDVTVTKDFEFHIKVTDAAGGFDDHRWTITVEPDATPNTAPTLPSPLTLPNASALASYWYQIEATDLEDEGDLQYWIESAVGSTLPAWLKMDPYTGILHGRPGSGDDGTFEIVIGVTDRKLLSDGIITSGPSVDTDQLFITVLPRKRFNLPPRLEAITQKEIRAEEAFRFEAATYSNSDDGEAPRFWLTGQPSWISVVPETGEIVGEAPLTEAAYDVTFTINVSDQVDPDPGTASASVALRILPNNYKPTLTVGDSLGDGTVFLALPLSTSDEDGHSVKVSILSQPQTGGVVLRDQTTPASAGATTLPDFGELELYWGSPTITVGNPQVVKLELDDGFGGIAEYEITLDLSDFNAPDFLEADPPILRLDASGNASTYTFDFQVMDAGTTASPLFSGTLGIDPASEALGMSVTHNVANATLTWNPTTVSVGTYTTQISATKGGITSVKTFEIEVRPHSIASLSPITVTETPTGSTPPVVNLTNVPSGQIRVGEEFRFRLPVTATSGTLQFTVLTNLNLIPIGVFEGDEFVWTPQTVALTSNAQQIDLEVMDGGGSRKLEFNVEVYADFEVNEAPTFALEQFYPELFVGQSIRFRLDASDPNGDRLYYEADSALQPGMDVSEDGWFTWKDIQAAGSTSIDLTVVDRPFGDASGKPHSITLDLDVAANARPEVEFLPEAPTLNGDFTEMRFRVVDPGASTPATFVVKQGGATVNAADISIVADGSAWILSLSRTADLTQPITIEATDTVGATGKTTISPNASSALPRIVNWLPRTWDGSNNLSHDLRAYDPEGAELTYKLEWTGTEPATLPVVSTEGLVTWTTPPDGLHTFRVRIAEQNDPLSFIEGTWTILVSAEAPNLAPRFLDQRTKLTATQGKDNTFDIDIYDPEGEVFILSLGAEDQAKFSAVDETISFSGNTVTWHPTSSGQRNVTILASYPSDGIVRESRVFLFEPVVNDLPEVNNGSVQVHAGDVLEFPVDATDADGDKLDFQLVTPPAGITIDSEGVIHWAVPVDETPTTTPISLTVEVSDGRGPVVPVTVDVTVLELTLESALTVQFEGSSVANGFAPDDATGIKLFVDIPAVLGATVTVQQQGGSALTHEGGGLYAVVAPVGSPGVIYYDVTATAGNETVVETVSLTFFTPSLENLTGSIALPIEGVAPRLSERTQVTAYTDHSVAGFYDYAIYLSRESEDYADSGVPIGSQSNVNVTSSLQVSLDPTLLENGTYSLWLVGTIGGNSRVLDRQAIEVDSNLKVGNLALGFTDLSVSLGGFPISLQRSYDSLRGDWIGDFGVGWELNFSAPSLTVLHADGTNDLRTSLQEGDIVRLELLGGQTRSYRFEPTPISSAFGAATFAATFVAVDDKSRADLFEIDLNSAFQSGEVVLQSQDDGSYEVLDPTNPTPSNRYSEYRLGATGSTIRLTTQQGLTYRFDASTGRLLSAVGPSGRELQIRIDGTTQIDVRNENGVFDVLADDDLYVDPMIIEARSGPHESWQQLTIYRDAATQLIRAIDDRTGSATDGRIRYFYDGTSHLTKVVDRQDVKTTFSYGIDTPAKPQDFLTEIFDANGTLVLDAYFADGRLDRIEDGEGELGSAGYALDLGNGLTAERGTDVNDKITEVVRDTDGNVVRILSAASDDNYLVIVTFYDEDNRVLRSSIPQLVDAEVRYSQTPLLSDQSQWRVVNTYYNDRDDTAPQGFSGTRERLRYGKLKSSTNSDGGTTTYDYDGYGNLVVSSSPSGLITYSIYDFPKLVQKLPGKLLATFTVGKVVAVVGRAPFIPDGLKQLLAKAIQVTDTPVVLPGEGLEVKSYTRLEYDDQNRLTKTFDALGRLVSQTNYNGVTGLVDSTVDADENSQYFLYDANGQQAVSYREWTDGIDTWTVASKTTFDYSGRPTFTRQYEWQQAVGTLPSLTISDWSTTTLHDGLLSETESIYDSNGRVSSTIQRQRDFSIPTPVSLDLVSTSVTTFNVRGNVVESRSTTTDETGASGSGWLVSRTLYDELGRAYFSADSYFVLDAALSDTGSPSTQGTYTEFDKLGRVVRSARHQNVQINLATAVNGLQESSSPFKFDPSDQGFVVTDQISETFTYYDDQGRARFQVDAKGLITETEFDDDSGRQQASVVYLSGSLNADKTAFDLSTINDLVADRLRTEFLYDDAGRQTHVILDLDADPTAPDNSDPTDRRVRRSVYDESGRVTRSIAEDGKTVVDTVYDVLGNRISQTASYDYEVWLDLFLADPYDAAQMLYQLTTDYEYDHAGRLTTVILPPVVDHASDALTGDQQVRPRYVYTFDDYGNRETITDPRGNLTVFTYNHRGQQTSRTLPEGMIETMKFDQNGRLELSIDFEGRHTELSYDTRGRLDTKYFFADATEYNSGNGIASETVTYKYDEYGRRLETVNSLLGTTTRTYDAQGQLKQIVSPEGTAVNYDYDPVTGERIRTYTDRTNVTYGYNDLGQLTSVETTQRDIHDGTNYVDTLSGGTETTTYGYDKTGRVDYEVLPGGTTRDLIYDEMGRVEHIDHFVDLDGGHQLDANEKVIASFDYIYTDQNRQAELLEQFNTDNNIAGFEETHRYRWKYDNLGRLVEEIFDDGDDGNSADDYIDRFGFDLAGNRVWKDKDLANSDPSTFDADEITVSTYDANDRTLTEVFDGPSSANDTNTVYEYGPNDTHTTQTDKTIRKGRNIGSGTVVETQTMEYNLQGRLKTVTTTKDGNPATISEYEYNEAGFRVSQTVDGVTTVYLVDPNNHTGYAQTLEERDDAGNVVKTFTIGLDVVTQATFTAVYHLLYDMHGSTRAVVDGNTTNAVQFYAYDAYGKLLDLSGFTSALQNAFVSLLYSGEFRDIGTGWDFNRARWSQDGRFNRLDDFAGDFFDPQSLHKILYAHGDPVNGVDPSGEFLQFLLAPILYGLGGALIGGLGFGALSAYQGGSFANGFKFGATVGGLTGLGLGAGGAIATAAASKFGLSTLSAGSLAFALQYGLGSIGAVLGLVGLGSNPAPESELAQALANVKKQFIVNRQAIRQYAQNKGISVPRNFPNVDVKIIQGPGWGSPMYTLPGGRGTIVATREYLDGESPDNNFLRPGVGALEVLLHHELGHVLYQHRIGAHVGTDAEDEAEDFALKFGHLVIGQ